LRMHAWGKRIKGRRGFAVGRRLLASALATVTVPIGAPAGAESQLTVILTGQSMIRSDLRTSAPAAFERMQPLLQGGDVIFTNLEGAIAEPGESADEGRGFLTSPQALDALQTLGFNLLALADNHAFDLKALGIANTLTETRRRSIVHAGIGSNLAEAAAPAYLHLPKLTVALVASASGLITPGGNATAAGPGVNELRIRAGGQINEATSDLAESNPNTPDPEDAKRILASIRAARRQADLVIVYQHNHVFGNRSFATIFSEGMTERLAPNEWLRSWTHAEVDAGADVVVMHGAPLLHGVEMYHGRPIFYDLGNFIYNLPPTITYIDEPVAWESVVARLEYRGKALQAITLSPIVLNAIGEGQPDMHDPHANNEFLDTRGLPSVAAGAKARYILERLAALSAPFGTSIEVSGETARISLGNNP
jgi:poly-gamma-glutamate capsule biosynthesis protein CapA/YwtB (metallophosphatase superfamily)